jgi:2-oxoisovalerate dehydrogenase E2 component (dihydrolipoyl transacylase)
VKLQASIQAFDPLCEVQSDKASVEITSPFDGVVKELLVKEGEIAKVGAGICLIEVDEETQDSVDPAVVEPVNPPPSTTLRDTTSQSTEKLEASSTQEHQDIPPTTTRRHPLDPKYSPNTANTGVENVLAPPSVRHFARKNGVKLDKLAPGSGKDGRIEKKDVEAYLSKGTGPSGADVQPATDPGKDVTVELGRTRYGMWKAMVKVRGLIDYRRQNPEDFTEFGNSTFRVSAVYIVNCIPW